MDNWKVDSQTIIKHKPGQLVYLTRSLIEGPPELLVVLWDIDPDEDEPESNHIPKYLCRTATHGKKVVFHCEVLPAGENGEKPSLVPTK